MALLACSQNVEIPRIKPISKAEFDATYLTKGIPVIIEDLVTTWPAKDWTLDSLCEKVGHNTVRVRANTSCDDYKLGRKYNIRETTFCEYVTDLRKDNKRAQSSYLAVQNLKQALPELQEDVPVPEYVGKLHGGPYLWIAHQGHYEYCHFDPDDGFLAMISGQKQIRLLGCTVEPLYPNQAGSKGRTVQSQVDCDNPDLEKHPLFSQLTCHHCMLGPGEMLYIPAFWWHQVTSVNSAISINMFWGDGGDNKYLTKVMESDRWPAFRHWLLNVVEQNRPYPAFCRTLSRLPEALHNFLMNQWHEKASQTQLQKLTQCIMDYLAISELPQEKSSGKHPPPLQIRGLLWRR